MVDASPVKQTNPAVTNRRQHPRAEYRVPIWLQPRDAEQALLDHNPVPGRCCDISAGGVRIQAVRCLTTPQVHLRFDAPNKSLITCGGWICWEKRIAPGIWEYGIKFEVPLPLEALADLFPGAGA